MSIFKLQQFAITQHVNAMKVCTDSLIFGALAPINNNPENSVHNGAKKKAPRVLDIGTGTGILSLMVMQRGAANVTALELMPESAIEAQENVEASPWADSITVLQQDFNDYKSDALFDLIISNPPFFDEHLKSDDKLRATARHTDTLSYLQLLTRSKKLLTTSGQIFLLLPCHVAENIQAICHDIGLAVIQQTDFITLRGGVAKVCALTIAHASLQLSQPVSASLIHNSLTIYDSHQQYSQDSARLLGDFLLRFND